MKGAGKRLPFINYCFVSWQVKLFEAKTGSLKIYTIFNFPWYDVIIIILERFRFGFQYLNRYLNLSLNQSDVSDLPYKPIKLFKNREKVAVVVEEVKSEPLYLPQCEEKFGFYLGFLV